MKSLILQIKPNEIPNKLFPFFLCQTLWSLHSFDVLNHSNPPLQLDADKNSTSWGSLERPAHANPVFSFRLCSCKTNLLNSACSCNSASTEPYTQSVHPVLPAPSPCLKKLIIIGSFQAGPGAEQQIPSPSYWFLAGGPQIHESPCVLQSAGQFPFTDVP